MQPVAHNATLTEANQAEAYHVNNYVKPTQLACLGACRLQS